MFLLYNINKSKAKTNKQTNNYYFRYNSVQLDNEFVQYTIHYLIDT